MEKIMVYRAKEILIDDKFALEYVLLKRSKITKNVQNYEIEYFNECYKKVNTIALKGIFEEKEGFIFKKINNFSKVPLSSYRLSVFVSIEELKLPIAKARGFFATIVF